jgi:hypothetical protein
MPGLRGAVRDAVQATLGSPPPRRKRSDATSAQAKVAPIGADWADWTAAIQTIATLKIDFGSLANRTPRALLTDLRNEAHEAAQRLPLWINALETQNDNEIA